MTMRATARAFATPVRIVEDLIRGYIERCPRASDSVRGIRHYWLLKQREWLVREAVGRLVERGEAEAWTCPNGLQYVRSKRT